ncbi:MAG: DUF2177 family protein [Alphaproteobacteria bacterium]|nr:DUF2177 family protein [Alphaproteobacteria bacterium]
MKKLLAAYVAALVVMLALDFVWLSLTGGPLYRRTLGDLLLDKFNLAPAVIFYLLYGIGVVIFAVSPAFDAHAWTTALVRGVLFGIFAYATYDLTNQATLRNWSTVLTVADVTWGAVLTGTAATAAYVAGGYWND